VEHTADAAIEVRARSVEGCFARAAAGMFACFTAPTGPTASEQTVQVDVEAEGRGELLVAWLEELLYESEVRGLALHDFTVTQVSRQRMKGSARGPRFGDGAETTGPAVKAVTRHGFELRQSRGYWVARVLFDV
jgi:SHS2 domain-containing protein